MLTAGERLALDQARRVGYLVRRRRQHRLSRAWWHHGLIHSHALVQVTLGWRWADLWIDMLPVEEGFPPGSLAALAQLFSSSGGRWGLGVDCGHCDRIPVAHADAIATAVVALIRRSPTPYNPEQAT